jgi:hypothetical protein
MLLLLTLSVVCVEVVHAGSFRGTRAARAKHQSPFLYAGNSFPVIEYMAPTTTTSVTSSSSAGSTSSSSDSEGTSNSSDDATPPDEPDFLYSPHQVNYRLVQFYTKSETSEAARDSFVATAAAILDIASLFHQTIDTYAVSCTAVPALCEIQGVYANGGPLNSGIFVLYQPHSTHGIRLDQPTAALVLDKMGVNTTSLTDIKWRLQLAQGVDTTTTTSNAAVRTLDDLKGDIHLAFDVAMRHFVYNRDHTDNESNGANAGNSLPLSNEQRTALKSWFLLIHKTLPPSWPIHSTVKELINSFMYVSKNEAYMLSILDANRPTATDFSPACRHQAGRATHATTDVTCGTWELFHAVTVGVVEYNKLSQAEGKDHMAPEAAASIMRDYVRQFGMDGDDDSTSQYFVQMADACLSTHCLKPPKQSNFWFFGRSSSSSSSSSSTDGSSTTNTTTSKSSSVLSDWIRLPLWLSQVHTDINMQIASEKTLQAGRQTTVQQHLAAAWPPHRYCPSCWNAATGVWNVEAVYQYLQLEYTQIADISPEVRHELLGMPLPRRFVETNSDRRYGSFPFFLDLQQSTILIFTAGVLLLRFLSVRSRILVMTPKSD